MAGLLDFENQGSGGLLGGLFNDPGARLGMQMLAASSPRLRGLGQVMAQQDAEKQQSLQRQYLQSQIAENATQNKQREMQMQNAMAQQARENAFFGMGGGSSTQGVGMMAAGGGQRSAMSASGGSGGPSASDGGMPTAGKFDEWSRQYGIPKDALVVDYLKNGGKGIAEMIAKRGTPDMQVTNGYAYNKNTLGAGYLPQLNISNDGKATQVQIGPDGLPVVSAPRGAAETFGTYQGIQAGIQSANTPYKVYNPATQREEIVPQASVLRGPASAQPQFSGSGYAGGSAAAAAPEQLQIMQSELNRLPPNHPDRPAIMREMQRLGGGQAAPQSGNYAAGPSATEAAAQEAARERAVGTAKADVARDSDNRTKVRSATENLSNADRAIELLKLGPTGSAVGSLLDRGAAVVGKSTSGGNIAAQLDIVSANMVKNVPRFEGPQSNIDVEGYKSAAGRVADRTLPIEQRIAAANEVKYFEQKAIRQAGGSSPEQPKAQQKEFSMLPKASEYDGKRMRAPDGTVYRSSGGRWNKE